MKTRRDLCDWIVEALKDLKGSAQIIRIREHIWDHHKDELIASGNLHFTWNEDIYWAATQLRAKGVLKKARDTSKSVWALACLLIIMFLFGPSAFAQTSFKHIPVEYIVALGDPAASSGNNAQTWGLWNQDPGPRGCLLDNYTKLKSTGIAPAQWKFDNKDWWLEEHGLIMEKPTFPLAAGQYVVTGGREVTAVLTVSPMDKSGAEHWELGQGARLYDVTHLPCHAARYTPASNNNDCSPVKVDKSVFPVAPGVVMPAINGCKKQDYAVLFVIGVAEN
jgi:hypothetical protein